MKNSRKMEPDEKKIVNTFKKVFPYLSDAEKERLLIFGEGMAFFKGAEQESEDGSGK